MAARTLWIDLDVWCGAGDSRVWLSTLACVRACVRVGSYHDDITFDDALVARIATELQSATAAAAALRRRPQPAPAPSCPTLNATAMTPRASSGTPREVQPPSPVSDSHQSLPVGGGRRAARRYMRATRNASAWAAEAIEGYCGITEDVGDCETGDAGSRPLDQMEVVSWAHAAHVCRTLLLPCRRAMYMSISLHQYALTAPAPCSLLPAPCSLFPTICSLLPDICSLLSAPCSLLPAPYSLLRAPYYLLPAP